ncbi:MAG: SIR2 family protein [Thermoanaerobaculia bacterium]
MSRSIDFGAGRFPLRWDAGRSGRILRAEHMLARALNLRTLVVIAGSGCSVPSGRPDWATFVREVVEHAVRAVERRPADSEASEIREQLREARDSLQGPEVLEAADLMYFLGTCKRLLDRLTWDTHPLARYVEGRFGPESATAGPDPMADPHRALAELPVSRYVTTNYDCDVEAALSVSGRIDYERFGLGPGGASDPQRLSFTQQPEDGDRLAVFTLARPRHAPMVFHCHGRFDRPESLIATEEDYQRWYLGQVARGNRHFLQAVQLLFGSNPLLFVGYGLRDEDLLRPLRVLGASHPDAKEGRPVFALLPEPEPGHDWHRHQLLFERYGVHVIPYSSPPGGGPGQRGRELAEAIRRLKRVHTEWLDGWLQKPVIRKVVVRAKPPRPYRHYSIDLRGHQVLGAEGIEEALDGFVADARAGARVLCLVGRGGAGKSWHATRLLERVQNEAPEFEGFFFWSSYYADDALTGLDRALAYLDPHDETQGTRNERFAECLRRGRFFLVFDGFERLLRESAEPEVGIPFGKGPERLLEAIGAPDSRSTVVITSRLRPAGLPARKDVLVRRLRRLRTHDLRSSPLFTPFVEHAPALCSLLEGHAYGLLLAGEYLRLRTDHPSDPEPARSLRRILASTSPNRRMGRMIGELVDLLDGPVDGMAVALMERVAVFMSPVSERALDFCFDEARRALGRPPEPAERMGSLIDKLLEARLLFRVVSSEGDPEEASFTVHATVRSYLFYRAHRVTPDTLPNFTLPGFTSGTAMASPSSAESAVVVRRLFERLVRQGNEAWERGEEETARGLCRNAFSVLRSRLEAITAPRWTSYPEYQLLSFQMVNLARRVSPRLWDFRERHQLDEVEHPRGPLYADELAWIYNDMGLTLCAEGSMSDTYAVWEQGYEINQVIEGGEAPGQYVVQSQLHLAHTFIEMGLLQTADEYLQQSEQSNRHLGDRDYQGRIIGYRGLLAHLRGDRERAEDLYAAAIERITEAGGNPRAESIFRRYWADLNMAWGDLQGAKELLRTSWAVAESSHHPDLLAFVIKSQGRWHREKKEFREARLDYDDALARARKFGIRRVEADVLSELSRLALALGDTGTARQRAMEALAIAKQLGLGLRQTHGMVVLGMTALEEGDRPLGLAYLRHARRLASRQQYWSRGREAERALQAEGEPVEFEW